MKKILMSKPTALWLVDNTSLTFEQIAKFCNMHPLEIQAIANGDIIVGAINFDPIIQGQVKKEDIKKCEKDPSKELTLIQDENCIKKSNKKKYINSSKKIKKLNAILWILQNHPKLSVRQICLLLKTTKNTINMVKDKTHSNIDNVYPENPISLSLCTKYDLEQYINE